MFWSFRLLGLGCRFLQFWFRAVGRSIDKVLLLTTFKDLAFYALNLKPSTLNPNPTPHLAPKP